MLSSALQFLSEPLYFVGFSVAMGAAYVIVWVISLREVAKPERALFLPAEAGPENGRVLTGPGGSPRPVRRFPVPAKPNQSRPRITRRAA